MQIFARRWNDPPGANEQHRILITRYRPRGVKKADETWTEWQPNLGPSAPLLSAFQGKGREAVGWSTYRIAYLKEMRAQQPLIASIARRLIAGETVALLCSASCTDERRCHRSLLRGLIEAEFERQRDQQK